MHYPISFICTVFVLVLNLTLLPPVFGQQPDNIVNITGTHTGDAYGNSNDDGFSDNLPAHNNELNILSGGEDIDSSDGGAYATDNIVNITI